MAYCCSMSITFVAFSLSLEDGAKTDTHRSAENRHEGRETRPLLAAYAILAQRLLSIPSHMVNEIRFAGVGIAAQEMCKNEPSLAVMNICGDSSFLSAAAITYSLCTTKSLHQRCFNRTVRHQRTARS
jgi:hypothetical protein